MQVIMGENIDLTLGMYFGLSTMVAAGIGNLFSDVVGLFFADFFGVGGCWVAIGVVWCSWDGLRKPRERGLAGTAAHASYLFILSPFAYAYVAKACRVR